MTGTTRIERDPLYWKVDDHFIDGLIYDIPGKLKDLHDDATISEAFGTPEQEHRKREIRRDNEKLMIIETRKQRVEIELIRRDLKPFLIAAGVFKYLWKHIILVVLTLAAISVGSAWMTGILGGDKHETHPDHPDTDEPE